MSQERYKKGFIYKLVCNDTNVIENYIGSACCFSKRKRHHKTCCNNVNSKEYNHYKYIFIREHGGWENWSMILVKEFLCNSKRELEAEERTQMELIGGQLNVNRPFVSEEEKKEESVKLSRKYREANKELLIEKRKEMVGCRACKCMHTKMHFIRHTKTKKHINNIKKIY